MILTHSTLRGLNLDHTDLRLHVLSYGVAGGLRALINRLLRIFVLNYLDVVGPRRFRLLRCLWLILAIVNCSQESGWGHDIGRLRVVILLILDVNNVDVKRAGKTCLGLKGALQLEGASLCQLWCLGDADWRLLLMIGAVSPTVNRFSLT